MVICGAWGSEEAAPGRERPCSQHRIVHLLLGRWTDVNLENPHLGLALLAPTPGRKAMAC